MWGARFCAVHQQLQNQSLEWGFSRDWCYRSSRGLNVPTIEAALRDSLDIEYSLSLVSKSPDRPRYFPGDRTLVSVCFKIG